MANLEQWRTDFERWGALRFLHIRIMTFLKRWLTLCRVNVRRLDPNARVGQLPEGFSVRLATREEALEAARDPGLGLRASSVIEAFDRGDLCAAAFHHDRMVAYSWRSFTTAPHIEGLSVTFDRPYRYGYRAFTLPEYRGKHLQDELAFVSDAPSIARGYTHGIDFIETHNYASIAQDVRRGHRIVGWAGYFTLFGRIYPFRTPGARRHTFRFTKV
jgi:hypothetical protein